MTDPVATAPPQKPRLSERQTLLRLGAVSIAFTVFGFVMLIGIRVKPEQYGDAPMAEYYLSMLCRCVWHGPKRPWSIHLVDAPYRYRVLVPWLAGFLPVSPPTALSTVTYASLIAFFTTL